MEVKQRDMKINTSYAQINDGTFAERMELGRSDKERVLKFAVSGNIIELGCGTGVIIELVMNLFPDSKVVGLDCDEALLRQVKQKHPNITVYHRNLMYWYDLDEFRGRYTTVVLNGTLHEIDWPYGRGASEGVIQTAYELLVPGGVLIFRDGVKPKDKDKRVEVVFKTQYAERKFKLFVEQYRQRKISYSYVNKSKAHVQLSFYDLHDMLNKYFFEGYLWERDMDETFGQMNSLEYCQLIEKYFTIAHFETYAAPYLRILWERDFKIVNSEYPDSHVLIVGRK